jgi:hypothetical protein
VTAHIAMDRIMSDQATYVYGVAIAECFGNGCPPVGAPGIGGKGAEVRTIPFHDLVAVVSDVPGYRFDLTRENLLEHQRVLEEVLGRSDVLPFSFGTVAGSDDEVRELLLQQGYEALQDQLQYVRGCVELEVKAFWERDRLFAEIAEENEEIRSLRDTIPYLAPEEVASAQLTLGQLTESEMEVKSTWEADGLLDVLEQHAVDVVVSPNLTDAMLLNAAFLVERTREKDFDSAMYGLGEQQKGRLVFNYVGPLPPYSFINLAFSAQG